MVLENSTCIMQQVSEMCFVFQSSPAYSYCSDKPKTQNIAEIKSFEIFLWPHLRFV